MKEDLIEFLNWIDYVMEKDPMSLETENDDIAQMYIDYLRDQKQTK